MTTQEELELLLQIMQKHDLPMSPILEYAINEKLNNVASPVCPMPKKEKYCSFSTDENGTSQYEDCLRKLSTGTHNGKRLPHKAVLLLSIIRLIGDGIIIDNRIGLDKTIANAFSSTWDNYKLGKKVPSVWIPFWYMKSEPFWHFEAIVDDGVLENLISFAGHPTVGQMRKVIKYAYLDDQLFSFVQDETKRTFFSNLLVETYLNN